ncbi:hypothetical protein Tco_0066831 [Tanacetum coccineum]
MSTGSATNYGPLWFMGFLLRLNFRLKQETEGTMQLGRMHEAAVNLGGSSGRRLVNMQIVRQRERLYHLQDLVCQKCKQIKASAHLAEHCGCAGSFNLREDQ